MASTAGKISDSMICIAERGEPTFVSGIESSNVELAPLKVKSTTNAATPTCDLGEPDSRVTAASTA